MIIRCLVLACLLVVASFEAVASPVVAFIGDEAVTCEELQYWEKRLRVTDLMAHQNTEAFMQFRRHKMLMGLFREQGLIEHASHAFLLRQQTAENERRKQAKTDGQVVYGPVFLQTDAYLDYLTSQLETELMRTFQQQWPTPAEVELLKLYERNRAAFRMPDQIHIEVVTIASGSPENRQQLVAETLQSLASTGKINPELMQRAGAQAIDIKQAQMIFDDTRPISEGETEQVFFQTVQMIREGQTVIHEEISGETTLIFCSQRMNGGYRHFDDVRSQLNLMHFNQAYTSFIQNLLDNTSATAIGSAL